MYGILTKVIAWFINQRLIFIITYFISKYHNKMLKICFKLSRNHMTFHKFTL